MRKEIPIITPGRSHREAVRRLMRGQAKATLATTMADRERDAGAPYASLVTIATDHDGAPILLLSGLSDHTRNLAADDRAALLVDGTGGLDAPQTGERATLMGRVRRIDDPAALDRCRRRFLARHPSAALYAGFGDFAFFRLDLSRAHYVGGFARAVWIDDGASVLTPAAVAEALAAAEPGIVGHMNEDHADAVGLYATRLLGQPEGAWRLAAIDADGCDLTAGEEGPVVRLPFPQPLADAAAARAMLVDLARQARGGMAAPSGD